MNSKTNFTSLRNALLKWYRRHQRNLPWRGSEDPYSVWISEIMLQQTQVATVIPYFTRFIKKFPNVHALAQASQEEVLKTWEGLGYYSRARNLCAAAQRIVVEHGGKIPDSVECLLDLPGIGRSTAGAIASIAFGRDEPVLDGNVQRVLTRLFHIRQNVAKTTTQRRLWTLAGELIPPGKAGQFNQALMDLGATICAPKNPNCGICPCKNLCQARRRSEQNLVPIKKRAKATPHYDIAVGVIWKGEKILIDRRKSAGLLGGLWEFPGGKKEPAETLEACLKREVREEVGIEIHVGKPIIAVKHSFSHFRITLHAFHCRFLSGRSRPLGCEVCKWVRLEELEQFPFPRANHKIIAVLRSASN